MLEIGNVRALMGLEQELHPLAPDAARKDGNWDADAPTGDHGSTILRAQAVQRIVRRHRNSRRHGRSSTTMRLWAFGLQGIVDPLVHGGRLAPRRSG